MHFCTGCTRPLLDCVYPADVFEMNPLILIDEEDRALCGLGNFFDLVFTEVGVETGFFIQAMGFIHNQSVECVVWNFMIASRTGKKFIES